VSQIPCFCIEGLKKFSFYIVFKRKECEDFSMLFDHSSTNKVCQRSIFTVTRMVGSSFWISFGRIKIENFVFHHWKEEMKMHRIMYCRIYPCAQTRVGGTFLSLGKLLRMKFFVWKIMERNFFNNYYDKNVVCD
jgi:hypothetical protein